MAVITIRRIYGDKLNYGFKTPFFPIIPIIGIFLKLGLAIFLLIIEPISWVITIAWVVIGFIIYRVYTFRKEIDHYAPIITSVGDLSRRDFRILIPYTPENPDRLLKYALWIARENDGELNILRVITVPKQTPLSAGIAYAEAAKKSFEPLERLLDKENILNHYLVRISHDASEAILATVEEQKIDLLITDFEAFRNSKKIQTILTCDVLGILAGGGEDFLLNSTDNEKKYESESSDANSQVSRSKKNLVVLYDGGDHSDIVLKTTSWLEHSGLFKINILYVNTKREENRKPEILQDVIKQTEYLQQSGVEFNEITLSEDTLYDTVKSSDIIESALNSAQPDLLVVGATISKFSFLSDTQFVNLLYQFKCPVIVARHFSIPGVHRLKSIMVKVLRLST